MKNIHVLPTSQPSRLACDFDKLILNSRLLSPILYKTQNIYITSDEEIKEGDWFITKGEVFKCTMSDEFIWRNNFDKFPCIKIDCKKIILTTDQDLIGVQAIDDEFLEWFVKNPSCEVIKTQLKLPWESSKDEYEIIIPKEEPEQETIGEAALKYSAEPQYFGKMSGFRAGVKWQMERSYNEEDMKKAFEFYAERTICDVKYLDDDFNEFIKQFKK